MLIDPIEVGPQGTCRIEQVEYSAVGFGTYPHKGDVCAVAVEEAAQYGYRIIDTATFYENFIPVGESLRKHGRKQFYLVSKVWRDSQTPAELRKDLDFTLKQLGTDYLDAYFLHWPNSSISIEDTLHAMEELRQNKKIRHIGLSNVTIKHLKRALEVGVCISWVQVEMNPYFYEPDLLAFCRQRGIAVQAWAPLGRGRISNDVLLTEIGKKYSKTASQVAIRWIVQHGCVPLPGSKSAQHIRDNFSIMDFTLTSEDMEMIDKRAKNGQRQRVTVEMIGWADEFDFSYQECWPK